MNIFFLDRDIAKNVQYHNDKHVIKMCLEYAQQLNTVAVASGEQALYRPTHAHHPCVLWLMESLDHWLWLKKLALALGDEYFYRYGRRHKSIEEVVKKLPTPNLPTLGWLSDPPQAMPEQYRGENAVEAYRRYYQNDKARFSTWKKRPAPDFMKNYLKHNDK
jgi:hypothetical protein